MTAKILIGDDQVGSERGEALRLLFEMTYRQAFSGFSLDYTADPKRFIELAKTREYAVLFIDLKWGPYLPAEGYRLLQECREYAPIMILWTSESAEARERGYQHGATHCIGKNPLPEELEEILAEVK
jgi:DNA-binding response OmpR family regulator